MGILADGILVAVERAEHEPARQAEHEPARRAGDEPAPQAGDEPARQAGDDATTQAERSGTSLRWRVPAKVPALKIMGALALLAGGPLLADGDPVRLALAVLAATGLAGWAVRDLVAPVRISADAHGVTVLSGFAGQRRIAWREIERITLDTRSRRGVRSENLEIDTGDSLHVFGRYDLDAPLDDVAAALLSARDRAVGHGR